MLDATQQAQATKPCKKTVHGKGGFVVQLIPDFGLKDICSEKHFQVTTEVPHPGLHILQCALASMGWTLDKYLLSASNHLFLC